jgi:hypothetical protein
LLCISALRLPLDRLSEIYTWKLSCGCKSKTEQGTFLVLELEVCTTGSEGLWTYVGLADDVTASLSKVTGEVSSQIPEVADPVNVVTDPVLDSKPEVVRVLELVGSKMSEDWEKFAVYLGFKITKLPTIRSLSKGH